MTELADAPRSELHERFNSYAPNASPPGRSHYIYLHDRCRTFLNKAILIDRNVRETYMPYLDHEWLEAVTALPIEERLRHNIQIELIRRAYPALLDVPYAKDLIRLGAPDWQRRLIKGWRRASSKLKKSVSLTNRHRARLPVSNSTHWSTEWTRNEMRPVLTDLLYNPNAAFRDFLRWDKVKPLLDRHFSGEQDMQSLLGALSVFEVASRARRTKASEAVGR